MEKRTIQFLCLVGVFIVTLNFSYAQKFNPDSIFPDVDYDNVWVKKISSDKNKSTFLIWIKDDVKRHKHIHHSESVYVISGTATMVLGDKIFDIKSGDLIEISENTSHAVKVTSPEPLKVISIQSPEFNGDDRILVDY